MIVFTHHHIISGVGGGSGGGVGGDSGVGSGGMSVLWHRVGVMEWQRAIEELDIHYEV